MAETAVATVTADQHSNDVRQEFDCRVVVEIGTGGMAVDPDSAATIRARKSDVGVTHGHLIDKLVFVIAYKGVPLVSVDDTHEGLVGNCRCLPNMALRALPWGPDQASLRLKAEVRATRSPAGASTVSLATVSTTPVPSLP